MLMHDDTIYIGTLFLADAVIDECYSVVFYWISDFMTNFQPLLYVYQSLIIATSFLTQLQIAKNQP